MESPAPLPGPELPSGSAQRGVRLEFTVLLAALWAPSALAAVRGLGALVAG